ncbi:MAG: hypothetical protein AYK19_12580 [Theionarchaea archaeon DG-70-1]|nr:MAG: hypothetical protein AYK19_12580 [Theionarchaea archaeon DG-70-1]
MVSPHSTFLFRLLVFKDFYNNIYDNLWKILLIMVRFMRYTNKISGENVQLYAIWAQKEYVKK